MTDLVQCSRSTGQVLVIKGFPASVGGCRRERSLPLDQVQRVAIATGDGTLTIRLLSAGLPTPEDVVDVSHGLGEPYSHLRTRAMAEFEVPFEKEHRRAFDKVFAYLKRAGVITDSIKQRSKDVFDVKLT